MFLYINTQWHAIKVGLKVGYYVIYSKKKYPASESCMVKKKFCTSSPDKKYHARKNCIPPQKSNGPSLIAINFRVLSRSVKESATLRDYDVEK